MPAIKICIRVLLERWAASHNADAASKKKSYYLGRPHEEKIYKRTLPVLFRYTVYAVRTGLYHTYLYRDRFGIFKIPWHGISYIY